jgi:two-component system, OmpR family, copper resistance phosphate regulon response regulator CusR
VADSDDQQVEAVQPNPGPLLRVADLELDRKKRTAARNGVPIALTPREFALLEALLLDSPRPVSREALLERVWGAGSPRKANVVNVFINHLRNKISMSGRPPLLHTVRGVGFVVRSKAT